MQVYVNKVNINYHITKRNEREEFVLFLHGFGGSIVSFEGLQVEFSKTFNTINLDLPSFGKSDDAPEYFTIFDYAGLVKDFLKQLNIKKVSIVSHSFGGRIAIVLGANYKELVNKIVLIDSAGIKPKFDLFVFLKIKYYKFLKLLVKLKLVNQHYLKKFGSSDYKSVKEAQKQVFSRIVREDLTSLLNQIAAPTLILWGKKDKATPLYMAKRLKKHIKNSGLVVFEKAGHFSYLEEAYKTSIIIKEFLHNKEAK